MSHFLNALSLDPENKTLCLADIARASTPSMCGGSSVIVGEIEPEQSRGMSYIYQRSCSSKITHKILINNVMVAFVIFYGENIQVKRMNIHLI